MVSRCFAVNCFPLLTILDFLRKDPLPNRQLRVYLWLTTKSPPQLLACNCPPIPPHGYNSNRTDGATETQATRAAGRYTWPLSAKPLAVQHTTPSQVQHPALGRRCAPTTPQLPLHSQNPIQTGHSQSNQNISRCNLPTAPVQQFVSSSGPPPVSGGICNSSTPHTSSYLNRAREITPNQTHQSTPQSTYMHSPNTGLPTNTSTSHVSTKSRSIFISGLDMNTTSHNLHVYLSTVGMLEACELQMNGVGQSNGCASARFATLEAAGVAVKRFSGAVLEGKTLLVRYDKTYEDAEGGKKGKKKDGVVIANGSTQRT